MVAGHGDSLPLGDGEADAVVFSLVLCMVPQQARTLAEAAHGGQGVTVTGSGGAKHLA